jgi:DNA-binding response OmpR family regulator
MNSTLCIVEDDTTLINSIIAIFEHAHYRVLPFSNASEAYLFLQTSQQVDLLLSDIVLGDGDGVTLAQMVRTLPDPPEVILLTGYGTLQSAISALRAGVADYLLKPCSPQLLLATVEQVLTRRRIRREQARFMQTVVEAVSRLPAPTVAEVQAFKDQPTPSTATQHESRLLHINELHIDRFTHEVLLNEQELHLTPTEYNILLALAEMCGRVLSYSTLVERSYGYTLESEQSRVLLKSHIHNLRLKLPRTWLKSVRSIGYLLLPST